LLKRVSKIETTKRVSYNSYFSDLYHINNLLKNDEWRFTSTIDKKTTTVQKLVNEINNSYNLDPCIAKGLSFSYHSYNSGYSKAVERLVLEENGADLILGNRSLIDKNGKIKQVVLDDIDTHVMVPKDTEVERDITCDSAFMLKTVHEVGLAIHYAYNWLHPDTPIVLFMDNTGGHGPNKAKEEYVSILLKKYKVVVEWQILNSLDTNLLDLGFWTTHQSIVDLKWMDVEALLHTIQEAFQMIDLDKVTHIYQQWEYILDLIMKGEGTNDLVEMNRRLTKSLDALPSVFKKYNNV
jgi:hypothetical protein